MNTKGENDSSSISVGASPTIFKIKLDEYPVGISPKPLPKMINGIMINQNFDRMFGQEIAEAYGIRYDEVLLYRVDLGAKIEEFVHSIITYSPTAVDRKAIGSANSISLMIRAGFEQIEASMASPDVLFNSWYYQIVIPAIEQCLNVKFLNDVLNEHMGTNGTDEYGIKKDGAVFHVLMVQTIIRMIRANKPVS